MKRVVAALLIVPLVPALLFGITMAIWGLVSPFGIDSPVAHLASIPIWSIYALPVSYAAALVVGVPAFFLFRHLGWLTLKGIMSGASIIGLAIGVAVAMLFDQRDVSLVGVVLAFIAFGATTGSAFWWMVYPRTNDDA